MNESSDRKDIQGKPAGKRRSCLGCLGRAALGLVIIIVAGAIYQAAASASDVKKYPPPGELSDVGEYRLHLYCTGGQPHRDPGSRRGNASADLVSRAEGSGRICPRLLV